MSPELFKTVESIALNITLVVLFALMFFAVHDVLKKNDVPKTGRFVAYGVLGLGAAGFVAKGIIEVFWTLQGI
ncbi:DUF2788 domain-containing protein [Glaciecola sp. XM2]|jgi:hypothetical protein|uniref:DUF2788 domain-containing protein n=1 Tax=Glaciecola sp. XM2 TaxID=1914931 RepID=UPI001BDE7DAA|nr:DUF2788 domain-containing protein [Glaciecola sp. XM2]MBT1449770.1 DUF2788 domain-containing protein [Glaciecola sp. XM2]